MSDEAAIAEIKRRVAEEQQATLHAQKVAATLKAQKARSETLAQVRRWSTPRIVKFIFGFYVFMTIAGVVVAMKASPGFASGAVVVAVLSILIALVLAELAQVAFHVAATLDEIRNELRVGRIEREEIRGG